MQLRERFPELFFCPFLGKLAVFPLVKFQKFHGKQAVRTDISII